MRILLKGGGVGILIREDLEASLNNDLSVFIYRHFESVSIDLTINFKKFIIISLYKLPAHPNMTMLEHNMGFLDKLE